MEAEKPREYTTQKGVVLKLNTVSNFAIRQIRDDKIGMPQPPIVETQLGPKKIKHREANPEDPAYKTALEEWQAAQNTRIALYVLTRGVANEPNEEELRDMREFMPEQSKVQLKYLWLLEQLGDDMETRQLVNVIMGQTIPTETGIGAAEERFPGDSEPESDQQLPTAEVEPDLAL